MGQRKEIGWLNFLKGIAIIAVVFDHMHNFLYQSEYLWSLSFYSVTLFTFVAGITSCLSMEKRMRLDCYDLAYTWKRLKKILIPYAVATAFYVFVKNQFFDFKTYLEALVTFSGAAPFYFIVYFVQLIVAAPLLFLVIYKIKRKSLHVLFLIGTAVFSGLCLKFTYIIKTWGGGQYFLGSTYLLMFVLGIYCWKNRRALRSQKTNRCFLIMGLIGISAFLIFNLLQYKKLANPPGLLIILYTFCIFACVFSGYYFLEKKAKNWKIRPAKYIEKIGHYSMDIFLYHLLLIKIFEKVGSVLHFDENIIYALAVYIIAIGVPIITRIIYTKIYQWLFNKETMMTEIVKNKT